MDTRRNRALTLIPITTAKGLVAWFRSVCVLSADGRHSKTTANPVAMTAALDEDITRVSSEVSVRRRTGLGLGLGLGHRP